MKNIILLILVCLSGVLSAQTLINPRQIARDEATHLQAMVYDSIAGRWKPGTISGGSIAIPSQQVGIGNGTAITSDTTFKFNTTTDKLTISSPSNKGRIDITGKAIEIQPDTLLSPGSQTFLKILSSKSNPYTYAPFGLSVEYGSQTPYNDYVWTFGPNAAANTGVAFEITKPMGSFNWETSWITGTQPVWERHEHFKEPDSAAIRLNSYTIYYKNGLYPSASSNINYYHTADQFELRGGATPHTTYFSTALNRVSGTAITSFRLTSNNTLTLSGVSSSGADVLYVDATSGGTQKSVDFRNWNTLSVHTNLTDPTIPALDINNAQTGGYGYMARFYSPNLGSGFESFFKLGKSDTAGENGFFSFIKNASSSLNRFYFGINGSYFHMLANGFTGLKTITPAVTLDVNGTDAIKIPSGTLAQRPAGVAGYIRYNSDSTSFEGYTNQWRRFLTAADFGTYSPTLQQVTNKGYLTTRQIRTDSMFVVRGTESTVDGIQIINTTATTGATWTLQQKNTGQLWLSKSGLANPSTKFIAYSLYQRGWGHFGPVLTSLDATTLLVAVDSAATQTVTAVENKMVASGSHAQFYAKTPAGSGDPMNIWEVGSGGSFSLGIDNSAGDTLKFGVGTAVGSGTFLTVDNLGTPRFRNTGGMKIPVGTTAQRVAEQGMFRYNTTVPQWEGYNGTTWDAFGSGGGSYTSSNGLTLSGSNFVLGGTLTANTSIATGIYNLTLSTTAGSTTSGLYIYGGSTNPLYVDGRTRAADIESENGTAVYSYTYGNRGLPGYFESADDTLKSTSRTMLRLKRSVPTGTQLAGIGESIDYQINDVSGQTATSNRLISSLTTITGSAATSEFSIKGIFAGTESTLFTLAGTGQLKLNKYVSSAFTGTAVNSLQVDASGNVIMGSVSGGSGDITNGGNTTGALVTIGTNDAFGLALETNNVTRATITGGASTGGDIQFTGITANTSTVQDRMTIQTNSSGTAAASFGGGILFQGESTTTDNQDMARISALWTTATHASRASALSFQLVQNAGALTEVMKIDRAGNSQGVLSFGTTTPVFITNNSLTTGTSYTVGGSSSALTLGGSSGSLVMSTTSNSALAIQINSGPNGGGVVIASGGTTITSTTLVKSALKFTDAYTVASGSGVMQSIEIAPTINLTGTASGAQLGLNINPTLTSLTAATYRGVNIPYSNAAAYGVYQSGASTYNVFVGRTAYGMTTTPTALVNLAAGTATTATAPLKFTAGVNLGTPETGAVEFDGTEFYGTGSSGNRGAFLRALKGSSVLDFPNTTASTVSDLTITVTGAAISDVVNLGIDNAAIVSGGVFSAWVSAADTVTVRFTNNSLGALNPASGTFKVAVVKAN